jgi:hypothetical protein
VYKWHEAERTWEEMGEAQGQSRKKKHTDGKMYDYIHSVELRADLPPMKLAFNRDDHPNTVARTFCDLNGIGPDYIPEIVDFITPMCDAQALQAKEARQDTMKQLSEATKLIHMPCWNSADGSRLARDVKVDKMASLLSQHQTELKDSGLALSDEQFSALAVIVREVVGDAKTWQSGPFRKDQVQLMLHTLRTWPDERLLPVLDCLRVLMCHTRACDALVSYQPGEGEPQTGLCELVTRAVGADVTHKGHMLTALRLFGNMVAKRRKHSSERKTPPVIPAAVSNALQSFLTLVSPAVHLHFGGATAQFAAYTVLCHNVVLWLGRIKAGDSAVSTALVDTMLVPLLMGAQRCPGTSEKSARTLYYALVTLGSIAQLSPTFKAILQSQGELMQATMAHASGKHRSVDECLQDLSKIL